MALKINKQAYTKLIEQDLEVLRKLPHSLELDHIKLVLTSSIDMYYPSDGSSQPSTERDCNMPLVSGSASRELVECADCGFIHYKDVRIEKRKNGWIIYHCPKCKSESTCKV